MSLSCRGTEVRDPLDRALYVASCWIQALGHHLETSAAFCSVYNVAITTMAHGPRIVDTEVATRLIIVHSDGTIVDRLASTASSTHNTAAASDAIQTTSTAHVPADKGTAVMRQAWHPPSPILTPQDMCLRPEKAM